MISRPLLILCILSITTLAGLVRADTRNEHPPAVQHLIDQGVQIAGSFAAPGGMTGYVGEIQGRPVAFYLTPDRNQVVVGPMLSATGENLTEAKIQELVTGPRNAKAWKQLEAAHWVREGNADAPVIIYTFTDPNCPYCHRFHRDARPWVDAGRVQLRHILVGILRPDSLPKAATILGADDPQQALRENQDRHARGGIEVDPASVANYADTVRENNQLMSGLGLHATPSTYYRDASGLVQMKQGAPRPEEMPAIMGSPRP